MHLQRLQVDDFRCIRHYAADLPSGRILIAGDNALGKTTLLETVFYLVTGRSFRTRADVDCLPWGAPSQAMARIFGTVRRAAGDTCRLSLVIAPETKSIRVDDQPLERLAALWGQLRAVLFTPDDVQLIKGGPANRRRYIDICLSQINPDFLFHLQRYNAALRQRNALLKHPETRKSLSAEQTAPWDEQLARHGIPILLTRFDLLHELESLAAEAYRHIARGDDPDDAETLRFAYGNFLRLRAPCDPTEAHARFLDLLRQNLPNDVRLGQTSIGPHRDDVAILLSDKPVRSFGSQGQVRSCVLAMRLAEARGMARRSGESPVLLFDDLASELDPKRKKRVMQLLDPAWQTFLTTTRAEDFPTGTRFDQVIQLPLDSSR